MTSQTHNTTLPNGQRDSVVTFDRGNQQTSTTLSERNLDKRTKNKKCSKTAICVFVLILGLYGYVLYKEVIHQEESRKETVTKQSVTTVEHSTLPNEGFASPRTEKLQGHEHMFRPRKESYRLPGPALSWISSKDDSISFSETVPDKLCIRIKYHGHYDLFNKITLEYEKATSLFHSLEHVRANKTGLAGEEVRYIIEKNIFQWNPPQTGKVPSTLLTVDSIEAAPGDMFCVKTLKTANIYLSNRDNHLVITKVG